MELALSPAPPSSPPQHSPPQYEEQLPPLSPRCERIITSTISSSSSSKASDVLFIALLGGSGIACAACSDLVIRVWRHADGAQLGSLLAPSAVTALLMVGNKLVSGHEDGKIRIWRFSKAEDACLSLVAALPTLWDALRIRFLLREKKLLHTQPIVALALGNSVVYSASAGESTVKVWRTSDFRYLESIPAHDQAISSIAASPKVSYLFVASAGKHAVEVWCSSRRRHALVQMLIEPSPVHALAVDQTGTLLYSGLTDSTISVWERQESSDIVLRESLRGHRQAVTCLATTDGFLCSSSAEDKSIRLWRRPTKRKGPHSCMAVFHTFATSLALIMDRMGFCNIYAGTSDNQIKVWRIAPCDEKETDSYSSIQQTCYTSEWRLHAMKFALDEGSLQLAFQALQC